MNTKPGAVGGGQPNIRRRLHHWLLLWQYKGCWKGIHLILKNSDLVELMKPPRPGAYTWETGKGSIDSSEIEAVIDRSEFGYS